MTSSRERRRRARSGPWRGFLTADPKGIRFALAFSDERALARYAVAHGEAAREWATGSR
ncbi:hypothetical protein [Streptomyces sp. NPDC096311]|uniref:hypothetical protein n=1 Tax=Streptomyces sp. NPDC096311 TaxID=3366083 RepID=UPI003810C306